MPKRVGKVIPTRFIIFKIVSSGRLNFVELLAGDLLIRSCLAL